MRVVPSMVDMKMDAKETAEFTTPSVPEYPYGLSISLCQDELDKLELTTDGVNIGDMVHMHCLATVTSISKHDNQQTGPSCRVELQITHISAESEDEENETPARPQRKDIPAKLYRP